MNAPRPPLPRLARQAIVLLVLMTLATVGGPALIALTLPGGEHGGWPPDRPIEWAVFVGSVAVVGVLMGCAVGIALANQRAVREQQRTAAEDRAPIEDIEGAGDDDR